MEMRTLKNRADAVGGFQPQVIWRLRESIEHCLMNKGIGRACAVTVKQNGKVVELSGNVDTEWTHCEILSMLPDEERCVMDNIEVTPLPA